jgi:ribonuclease T1
VAFPGGGCADARRSPDHVLTVVEVDDLPREARETLALIKQGGPFPYKRDGVVFGNRERRLPARSSGYYREYTVPTPGARDRGARRIIAGESGEYYYTGDHYNTFRRIRE